MTQEYLYLPETIDIYISYTRRDSKDGEIGNAFYTACEKHPMLTPHIDKENLKDGDEIYRYMDELSAARFVVCVFSPEYFKSENCVYEFAGLCHNGYMADRVFPLFQKHFFSDNQREEWMTAKITDENLQKRVKDKTGKELAGLIEQVRWQDMDKLAGVVVPLASEDERDNFQEFIDNFLEKIDSDNKRKHEEHKEHLVWSVKETLGNESLNTLLPHLADELSCRCDKDACAKKLFDDVYAGIISLHNATTKVDIVPRKNSDIKEIVGRLLVSVINPGWWVVNEFHLENTRKKGKSFKADGMIEHEIEIVFARLFDRPAMYEEVGTDLKSTSSVVKHNDISFTTDAEVIKKRYLIAFFEEVTTCHFEGEELTSSNEMRLRGSLRFRGQHYCIILPEVYEKLVELDVVKKINEVLEGMITFVVLGKVSDKQRNTNVLTIHSEVAYGCICELFG